MKRAIKYTLRSVFFRIVLVFSTIILYSQIAQADYQWRVEHVDFGDAYTSVATDTEDYPHIAFGNTRYAQNDQGSWHVDFMEGSDVSGQSLIIDASGHRHLSYYQSPNRYLIYAKHDGVQWIYDKQTISYSYTTMQTSLQVDSLGRPHVVHPLDGHTCYRYFDGQTWQIEIFGGYSLSGKLKLDGNDQPHFVTARHSGSNDVLTYRWYDGTVWHTEEIDLGGLWGDVGFDLDSTGQPHFIISGGGLKHIHRTNTGWQTDIIEPGNGSYRYITLIFDNADNMHLAFYDEINDDLLYAYYDGDLSKSIVDQEGNVGSYASMDLDSNNLPHLAYYDTDNEHMKYARMISETFVDAQFEILATSGPTPMPVSFADYSTGEITSWYWEFGDGVTSSEQNPTHIYSTPGHYDVCLTVSGPSGSKTKRLANAIWTYRLPQNEHYVAYVGEYGASQLYDMLSTIDCRTNTIIYREELPDTPHGISATQDGRKILLSLYYSGTAVKFDTTDSNMVSYFDVPGASNSTISPDGEYFYVSSNTLLAKVTRIKVENDDYKIISMENFETGYTPAIMPNNQSLFVGSTVYQGNCGVIAHIKNLWVEAPEVEPVSIRTNPPIVAGCANPVVAAPDGRHIYTASYSYGAIPNYIIKIPYAYLYTPERKMTLPINGPADVKIWAMAISPDNHWLYITMATANVHVVDLETFNLSKTISIGGLPRGLAFTPDGKYVYACTYSKVSVIDVDQQEVIDEIPSDRFPFVIAITRAPNNCHGDFDSDGDVDGKDLINMISNNSQVSLSDFIDMYGTIDCLP